MKQRIYSFDIIRILATFAILVFHWNIYAYHYGIHTSPILQPDFASGTLALPAVSLFFILSGASLMLSTRSRYSLSSYFKKRFLSIYPLYWLAYAVVFLLVYVLRHVAMDKPLATLPLSFLAMDGLLADVLPTWYLVGEWFVGCIVLLYLIFPLLRLAVRKAPGLSLLEAFLFMLIWPRVYPLSFDITHFPLTRAPEMVFGMVFVEAFYPEANARSLFVRVLSRFFGSSRLSMRIPEEKRKGVSLAEKEREASHHPEKSIVRLPGVYICRRLVLAGVFLVVGLLPVFVPVNLPDTYLAPLMGCGLFVGLELVFSLLLRQDRRRPLLSALSGMTYGIFLVHHIFVGEFLGKYLGSFLPQTTNFFLFLAYLAFVTFLGGLLTFLIQQILTRIRVK